MMSRLLVACLLVLLACVSLAVCTPSVGSAGDLFHHSPVIDAFSSHATDDAHITFVESESAAGAAAAAASAAAAATESAASLAAELMLDHAADSATHSPFRVRRISFSGESGHTDTDGDVDVDAGADEVDSASSSSIASPSPSLLEHGSPAHSINIPLTRSAAAPTTIAGVMLEVRARQQAHVFDRESFIAMSEGQSQDEMDDDALIELDAYAAHTSPDDLSSLELRSTDVPLYQEVLQEKHLATYYGTLRLGDEEGKNTFRVLFDTGSCELWIPSARCETNRCKRHRRMPESTKEGDADGTKLFGTTKMNIEYISGSVRGPMIVSPVHVGGLSIPGQILGLARTLDIDLLDEVVWDGIVGLAYPSKSLVTRGVTPLFDNIIKQKLLTTGSADGKVKGLGLANQFAYYIDDTQGVMTFGGVNCAFVVRNSQALLSQDPAAEQKAVDECKNSFQFVPVTRKTYWTITLDDVSLSYPKGAIVPAGQKLDGNCGAAGCRAIVDTGTYLVYTSKFFGAPAAWANFAHCRDTHLLPNITFHFRSSGGIGGGSKAAAPSIALTLEPRDYVLKFDNSRSKEDCVVGISPDKDAVFTLGQVFLRSYYALFDRDENRIGFSKIHRQGHDAVNAKPAKAPPVL